MHGVGRNNPMNQHRTKIGDVFDRVHRKTRPRPKIDIVMMEGMYMLIQKRHVQQAVYPVKIKALPCGDQQEHCNKSNRVCRPSQHRSIAIGQGPNHQHLKHRPDRDTAGQSPKHVVPDLPTQGKLPTIFHQLPWVVF